MTVFPSTLAPLPPSRAGLVGRLLGSRWLDIVLVAGVAPLLLFPRGWLSVAALALLVPLWVARLVFSLSPQQSAISAQPSPATRLGLPLLLLLVMAAQSLYPSVDLTMSLPKLYGISLGVAVYFAVVRVASGPRSWWAILGALLVAPVAVGALGFFAIGPAEKLKLLAPVLSKVPKLVTSIPASQGSVAGISPNEIGGTLAFLLPVALGVAAWGMRERDAETRRRGDAERAEPQTTQTTAEGVAGKSGGQATLGWAARQEPRPPGAPQVLPLPLGEGRGEGRPGGSAPGTPGTGEEARAPRTLARRLLVVAAGVSFPLGGGMLVLTLSRSAMVGLAAAVLVLVAVRVRWVVFVAAGGVVALVAGAAALGPDRIVTLARQSETFYKGYSMDGRFEIWNRAWYMIQDFPFTGIGLNTFPRMITDFYPTFVEQTVGGPPHAHNIFLQTAVDLGLGGLMAFVGMWAIVFWTAGRAYRRAEDPLLRGAVAGLAAGCVAYLVYGLTDAITLGAKPLALLWAMVGLIVAAERMGEGREPQITQKGADGGDGVVVEDGVAAVAAGRLGRSLALRSWMLRSLLETVWWTYWAVAVLFAVLAYVVVGISITGWIP